MQRNKIFLIILAGLALAPATAAAQWTSSRGGSERDGARAGTGDLPLPQVKWRHDIGGNVGSAAIIQIPDPVVPRIAITSGGRVSLKRWDDSLSWRGQPLGVSSFIGAIDFEGDGQTDLLLAEGGSDKSFVVGYTPDGEVVFNAEPGILGPVSSGARIVDLDGDGFRDLYLTSFRQGPSGAVAMAVRFPGGDPSQAEILYTIAGSDRDYPAGLFDIIAELDGTPGLEIMALGHRSLYVYDAATGTLESTTALSGFAPYARATMRVVDLDLDGISEVYGFSDQAWSENNNRRHVTRFAYSGGAMREVWSRNLGSDPGARLAFTDSSIVNLDGTGPTEIVFSVRNAAGQWTTEIRDATSGVLLDTIIGERFEDVALTLGAPLLFTHDIGQPLRTYRFTRAGGAALVGTHRDLRIVRCRRDRPTVREVPLSVPCSIPVAGVPRRGIVLAEYDPRTEATTALVSFDAGDTLVEIARYDGQGGVLSAVMEILPGHRAVLAVSHSDGVIYPLDERLLYLGPSPKPPFSWAGIRQSSRFSGNDLPAFPLAVAGPSGERIVTLSGAGRATVLDASNDPSVASGIDVVWTGGSGNRLVVDDGATSPSVVLINAKGAVTAFDAADGAVRWSSPDAFTSDKPLHSDPIVVTDPSTGVRSLWFHRRESNTGTYDLTALDLDTGAVAISHPDLDTNDGGWKRLSLATWDGLPAPISGRLGEHWRFDLDGAIAQVDTSLTASLVIPIVRAGQNPLLIVDGLTELAAYDPQAQAFLWRMPRNNRGSPTHGASLNLAGVAKYATSDVDLPAFRSIDVATGEVDFEYHLVGGELRSPSEALPVPAPLLGNATAINDLTGSGEPAYLVGSSDGFVYAIGAIRGDLLWALFVGFQVSEIITADWDGDSLLELVASAADGTLLGIDRFTGDGPAWVNDTNGQSRDDIDELATEDTLYVAWAPVANATSYEVAVFRNDGQPLTAGFADAGDRTEMAIRGLPLEPGVRYLVSVRAVSSLGVSPDEPSDGVTVIAPLGDGGGCCQVGTSPLSGAPETLLLAVLCLALTWRRRRRSR